MKILAMGKCVPRQILDNEALSHMVETNDEWITSRTGIRQRRIAKDETVVSMAAEAARQAMERAGTRPGEIGLVLVCTFTPDLAVTAGGLSGTAGTGAPPRRSWPMTSTPPAAGSSMAW